MYNIMFEPNIKRTYLSYPISAGDSKAMKEVRDFRDALRKSLVVFDPLAVKDIEWLTAALALKKQRKKKIEIPFTHDDGQEDKSSFNTKDLENVGDYLKD